MYYRTSEQLAEARSGWTVNVGAWPKRISRAYQAGDLRGLAPWAAPVPYESYHFPTPLTPVPKFQSLCQYSSLDPRLRCLNERESTMQTTEIFVLDCTVMEHIHVGSLGPQLALRDLKTRPFEAFSMLVSFRSFGNLAPVSYE